MNKFFIGLLVISCFSVWASTSLQVHANGYGGNEQLACISAKAEAKSKLVELCPYGKLENIISSECNFISEGDYFLVYSVKVNAMCVY